MRVRGCMLLLTVLAAVGPWPAGAARADDTAQTALSSFKVIAARYDQFFAKTRYVVDRQNVPWASPSGAYFVVYYEAKSVAYDVEATNSLVSPFLAHIDVVFNKSIENDRCGDYQLRGSKGFWGWKTPQDANASTARSNCAPQSQFFDDPVRFDFAYQDGKWVFKGATRAKYAKPEITITAAITGRQSDVAIPVSPADAPVNADWPTLAQP